MTTAWELAPSNPAVGNETPLLSLDRRDGPDGRTICVVPGNLSRRIGDGDFVRLVDEQDIANAAMILLLPRMRNTMFDLVEWACRTGRWDAPCWRAAEALVQQLRKVGSDARHK